MKYLRSYKIFEAEQTMLLCEFVSTAYDWKWISRDDYMWEAHFNTPDDKYEVDIFLQSPRDDHYKVRMRSNKYNYDKTGGGSAGNVMRVFTTMFDIMQAYLDDNFDKVLQFTGSDDYEKQKSPSRRDRIYKYIAENMPEEYQHEVMRDGRTIRMWKRNLDESGMSYDFLLLQRCQKGNVTEPWDFRIVNGQHGEGVYCFIAGDKEMQDYYCKNGEKVHTFKIDKKYVMNATKRNYDFWDAKKLIFDNPNKKAFIFRHSGPGIPTSQEVLITDPEIIILDEAS